VTPPPGGALVTGAGRGLGREVAEALAARGHAVHVTDVDTDLAQRVARDIGGTAFASTLDVRDDAACREAARMTVDRTGSLDVWVNNAGVITTGPAWEQEAATHRFMLEVNTIGTINGTLAALESMRAAGRGHIVNIVSLAGLVTVPGETVYSASKHAALAFSLGTMADLRLAGVRDIDISCVCPDGIWTPMLYDKLDDPQAALSFSARLLQPADVVAAVRHVLDRPRPVVAVPRWRGVQVRIFDALPRVVVTSAPLVLRLARMQQRRYRRRLGG
jgi:short-subunit dehydrogenase